MLAVDITEFLRNPIRTGIQRVVRELLRRWPAEIDMQLVYFDPAIGALRAAPTEIVDYCVAQDANPYLSTTETARIVADGMSALAQGHVGLRRGDRLLIPELFHALNRVQFYRGLHNEGIELLPVVYDLMVWTSPDAWNITYVGGLNDYLAFLSVATERAFISQAVRDAYFDRFLRHPAGDGNPVIPLGADALLRSDGQPMRQRPYFVCVGSLDGKKGQDAVHRAFLASAVCQSVDLIFLGQVPTSPRREMRPLLASTDPRIVVIDNPEDRELAAFVQGALASVFISRNEGFGLPAVESLYLGTPVIVAAGLPAMSNIEGLGQIRLRGESEQELVDAMERLARPDEAQKLRAEISGLALNTWDQYARNVAVWAAG